MIRRIRPTDILRWPVHPFWSDGQPYVWDCRIIDIASTLAAAIRNAPPGLVAVSVRPEIGHHAIALVERAARRRGARVIWLPIGRALR